MAGKSSLRTATEHQGTVRSGGSPQVAHREIRITPVSFKGHFMAKQETTTVLVDIDRFVALLGGLNTINI